MYIARLVCSSKKVADLAEAFGKKLVSATTSSGRISRQKLSAIVKTCTPDGIPVPSIFVSPEKARKIVNSEFPQWSVSQAKSRVSTSGGFFVYSVKQNKPVIFVQESFLSDPANLSTALTHEFRHFLDNARIGFKKISPKQHLKISKQMAIIQNIYEELYNKVYKDLGVANPNGFVKGLKPDELYEFLGCTQKDLGKYLRSQVRSILPSKSPRKNIKILKVLIANFESERNAFNIQGKILGMLGKIPENSTAKPTGISLYFEDLLKALKGELKAQQNYRISKSLGKNIPTRRLVVAKNPIKNKFGNRNADILGLSGENADNALAPDRKAKLSNILSAMDDDEDAIESAMKELKRV